MAEPAAGALPPEVVQIWQALAQAQGNVVQAARLLGVRHTLQQSAFPLLPAIFASNPSVIRDVQWQAQRTITCLPFLSQHDHFHKVEQGCARQLERFDKLLYKDFYFIVVNVPACAALPFTEVMQHRKAMRVRPCRGGHVRTKRSPAHS
jgi:hypothetical protein